MCQETCLPDKQVGIGSYFSSILRVYVCINLRRLFQNNTKRYCRKCAKRHASYLTNRNSYGI
jgi:hypothetical protein